MRVRCVDFTHKHPLSGFAASPSLYALCAMGGDDAFAARRLLLGISPLEMRQR